jgi:hypothetical protein
MRAIGFDQDQWWRAYFCFAFSSVLSKRLSIQALKLVVMNSPSTKRLKMVAGLGAFCAASRFSNLTTSNGSFRFAQVSASDVWMWNSVNGQRFE